MNNITISSKCIACGLCAKDCPSGIFKMEEKGEPPIVQHIESCIKCGHCEAICEPDAITCEPFRETAQTIEVEDNFRSLLATLRSVRHYAKKPLNKKVVADIVQAGYNAPTAQNIRQVNIDLIEGEGIILMNETVINYLEHLTKIGNSFVLGIMRLFNPAKAEFLRHSVAKLKRVVSSSRKGNYHIFHNAPHVIVLHAPRSNKFGKDDCDAAHNYMRIYAHSLGLGSCMIGFATTAMKPLAKALNLPKGNDILGVMILGTPTVKYARGIQRKVS
jgi:nitroreductase/NAD-dependent dihydropyrimidine dehydrogenase PreA subunit